MRDIRELPFSVGERIIQKRKERAKGGKEVAS